MSSKIIFQSLCLWNVPLIFRAIQKKCYLCFPAFSISWKTPKSNFSPSLHFFAFSSFLDHLQPLISFKHFFLLYEAIKKFPFLKCYSTFDNMSTQAYSYPRLVFSWHRIKLCATKTRFMALYVIGCLIFLQLNGKWIKKCVLFPYQCSFFFLYFPSFFNLWRPSTNVVIKNEVERLLLSDTPYCPKYIFLWTPKIYFVLKEVWNRNYIFISPVFLSKVTIVSECLLLKRVILSCHLVRFGFPLPHMYINVLALSLVDHTFSGFG